MATGLAGDEGSLTPSTPLTPSDPAAGPGRRPLSLGSKLARRPGQAYTEVDGHPVVVGPEPGRFTELAPATLALWAALDGRPLDEVAAAVDPDLGRGRVGTVDVCRRLRALGLIDDVAVLEREGVEAAGPVSAIDPPRRARVSLRGQVVDGGAGLALAGSEAGNSVEPSIPSKAVDVEVDPPAVVGAAHALSHIVLPRRSAGPGTAAGATAALGNPVQDPLAVFAALLINLAEPDLTAPGLVDALADLAEALPAQFA